jgi:hypothetical protein
MAVRCDLAGSPPLSGPKPYYVSSEYPDHGTTLQLVLVVYEGLVTCHSGSCRQVSMAVDDLSSFGGCETNEARSGLVLSHSPSREACSDVARGP